MNVVLRRKRELHTMPDLPAVKCLLEDMGVK